MSNKYVAINSVQAVRWNAFTEDSGPLNGYECQDHPAVKGTSYMEVSSLIGTSGCSAESPWWDWSVMGMIVTNQGRHLVIPGDWIVTDICGHVTVMHDESFRLMYQMKE